MPEDGVTKDGRWKMGDRGCRQRLVHFAQDTTGACRIKIFLAKQNLIGGADREAWTKGDEGGGGATQDPLPSAIVVRHRAWMRSTMDPRPRHTLAVDFPCARPSALLLFRARCFVGDTARLNRGRSLREPDCAQHYSSWMATSGSIQSNASWDCPTTLDGDWTGIGRGPIRGLRSSSIPLFQTM